MAENMKKFQAVVREFTKFSVVSTIVEFLAGLFYLDDESKSNRIWGLHVHMCQLACVADGTEVMWLNLAG